MRGGYRPKAGRKAIPIDLGQLENLTLLGCTDQEIAGFFTVSTRTIEQRRKKQPEFAEAMTRGRSKCQIAVRRSQMKWMDKDPKMSIWLGKQLLGQRDVLPIELSGPDGKQLKISWEAIDEALDA